MTRKNILIAALALIIPIAASAQQFGGTADQGGHLTGSFENNSIYYLEDAQNPGCYVPDGSFGSNSYLKADYYKGNLVAGLQVESYQPALVGYPLNLEGNKLSNFYMSWTDDDFSLTAGTFYDQFGSGLLFRTYADRTLGINNALLGARLAYNYKDILAARILWGMPRLGSDWKSVSDRGVVEWAGTQVRGADVSLALSSLLGWQGTTLAVEGSLLSRYEQIKYDMEEEGISPTTTGWSGRLNFEKSGFVAKAEWVNGGQWFGYYPTDEADYLKRNGNAQLLELGYSGGGLGANLTLRRMEWMGSKINYSSVESNNTLNYTPALCAQYSYMLTNLNPYIPEVGSTDGHLTSGEIGGQLDVYYNFRRGSAIGGKRGMKVNLNVSTYYAIGQEGTAQLGELLWRNVNVGVEKQVSRKLKMQLLWALQQGEDMYHNWCLSNIVVADLLYKFTPKFSTRAELQYLSSADGMKDWMAGLVEVNMAPKWSVFVSDMYNHGTSKVHYYSVGASYTASRTRIAFSYGRNRSGMVCSGGVCRTVKAFTGGNLTISTSF